MQGTKEARAKKKAATAKKAPKKTVCHVGCIILCIILPFCVLEGVPRNAIMIIRSTILSKHFLIKRRVKYTFCMRRQKKILFFPSSRRTERAIATREDAPPTTD